MRVYLCLLAIAFSLSLSAQPEAVSEITRSEVEYMIRFLSADELLGRKTGEQGNRVAARFIAEQLRSHGVKPVGSSYFQEIGFVQLNAAESSMLSIGEEKIKEADFVVSSSPEVKISGEMIYLQHALPSDLEGVDVKGKIVLAALGDNTGQGIPAIFGSSSGKAAMLAEKGALALIEVYSERAPWAFVRRYIGGDRLTIQAEGAEAIPQILIPANDSLLERLQQGEKVEVSFETSGRKQKSMASSNVIGVLEGADPELKEEYVILSAHYDHVGHGVRGDNPGTTVDSIFNGARDNAIGVAAVLGAADYLSKNKPKRSVLFIGFTAEELGLLGSGYYAENPLLPLEKMVFNLNSDGAGYSDTSVISVMGLNRVGAEDQMTEAIKTFGFEPFADPAPEQNLFDRSDNVNFAAAGIPAVTFTPGFKEFSQEIMKNYHQPSDEVETLDMNYVYKFCQAYALCAQLIANMDERPFWAEGDKYEAAGKQLYGRQ